MTRSVPADRKRHLVCDRHDTLTAAQATDTLIGADGRGYLIGGTGIERRTNRPCAKAGNVQSCHQRQYRWRCPGRQPEQALVENVTGANYKTHSLADAMDNTLTGGAEATTPSLGGDGKIRSWRRQRGNDTLSGGNWKAIRDYSNLHQRRHVNLSISAAQGHHPRRHDTLSGIENGRGGRDTTTRYGDNNDNVNPRRLGSENTADIRMPVAVYSPLPA